MPTRLPPSSAYYALRFRVLARDHFTCRYCGAFAPTVRLEVDHVRPVAEGGTDDEDNLVTACYACNRGKGDALHMHLVNGQAGARSRKVTILMEYIAEHGPGTATTIARALGWPRAEVSRTLANDAHFVRTEKVGRDVFYGLAAMA